MLKRKYMIISFLAFCLATTLFIGITTSGTTPSTKSVQPYDPWYDVNDDGEIDIVDVVNEAIRFGTTGNPEKNVNVTNFPLDAGGNLRVNITDSIPLCPDSTLEGKSKVIGIGLPPSSSRWIDIRPPPGEIWIIHYLKVVISTSSGQVQLLVVDNTTGYLIEIKSNSGSGTPNLELNAEVEHKPICTNEVYYRLAATNWDSVSRNAYFTYVGKRVK